MEGACDAHKPATNLIGLTVAGRLARSRLAAGESNLGCRAVEHDLFGLEWDAWVAMFTAALFLSTVLLWSATVRLARDADQAHRRVSRAFVYLKEFQGEVVRGEADVIAAHLFTPLWSNSGATPTVNALINTAWTKQAGELPDDFGYPFFDAAAVAFIGPQASIGSPSLIIPAADIADVAAGKMRVYLYGVAEYRDVFKDTPAHSTSFCFKLEVSQEYGRLRLGFPLYGPHNRSSDDNREIPWPRDAFMSFLASKKDVRRTPIRIVGHAPELKVVDKPKDGRWS